MCVLFLAAIVVCKLQSFHKRFSKKEGPPSRNHHGQAPCSKVARSRHTGESRFFRPPLHCTCSEQTLRTRLLRDLNPGVDLNWQPSRLQIVGYESFAGSRVRGSRSIPQHLFSLVLGKSCLPEVAILLKCCSLERVRWVWGRGGDATVLQSGGPVVHSGGTVTSGCGEHGVSVEFWRRRLASSYKFLGRIARLRANEDNDRQKLRRTFLDSRRGSGSHYKGSFARRCTGDNRW